MSPKDETCAVNIPAFLSKLWKIVNDPDIDNIISWSADGRSFIIQDQAQFWYNILPIYYKHNNMSSFVRQLNMYGFHKIHADGKDREHDELKFYHPFFRKNQPSLMKNIKRKMTATHRTPPAKTELAEAATQQVTNLNHMTKVLVDVKQLQTRQESVDNQLASMKKENAALWRELALLRQKHMKQQQLVNKLIHFLVHIVNPSRGNMGGMGRKRKYPLMINDIVGPRPGPSKCQKTGGDSSSDDGIIIHEVENEYILPNEKSEHENEEEALIDSPENIMMDSTDEFLDIPMTDEAVDSPDSLCPDNILAEDPNIDVVEAEAEAETETEVDADQPPLLAPASININDWIPSGTQIASVPSPSLSTVEAMFPNMSSVPEAEAVEHKTAQHKRKRKKKKSGKSKDKTTAPAIITPATTTTTKENLKLDLTVATRNSNTLPETSKAITLNSPDDFENHLEATQEELDSIKELLLDGYALDPSTVLNLNSSIFTDMPLQLFMSDDNLNLPQAHANAQTQHIPSTSKTNEGDLDFSCDPMVSGSGPGNELMPYNMANINVSTTNASTNANASASANTTSLLDFENLFENETSPENTIDPSMELMDLVNMADDADNQSTLNTPVQIKMEPPTFPSTNIHTNSSSTSNTNRNNNKKRK